MSNPRIVAKLHHNKSKIGTIQHSAQEDVKWGHSTYYCTGTMVWGIRNNAWKDGAELS
jgi:hypothetical protein